MSNIYSRLMPWTGDYDSLSPEFRVMKADAPSPVAIIAYNRPQHFAQTIESLAKNAEAQDTDLFIFSDAPRSDSETEAVQKVRQYAQSIVGFRSVCIIERTDNFGLAKSVAAAVDHVLKVSDSIIVLEDDLVTSPFFLRYMNQGLSLYARDEAVASIHGFFYDLGKQLPETFFLRGTDCLGWGTWRRAWKYYEPNGGVLLGELQRRKLTFAFDMQGSYPYTAMLQDQIAGKVSSWAIRWHAAAFLRGMVSLNPGRSLVKHIGNDGTGTNFGQESFLDTPLAEFPINIERIPLKQNRLVLNLLISFYRKTFNRPTRLRKTISKIATVVRRLFRR